MGITPAMGAITPGVLAVAIADDEGPTNGCGDGAGGPSHVEHLRRRAHHDPAHRRVTSDPAGRARCDHGAVVVFARLGGVAGQGFRSHHDRDVRSHRAIDGSVAVVEMIGTEVDESVGTALRRRAAVLGVEIGRVGHGFQGGDDGLAPFGIQLSVDADHAADGLRHVQPASLMQMRGVGFGGALVGGLLPVGHYPSGVTGGQSGDGVDQDPAVAGE